MELSDIQVTYWSDSANALHWIKTDDQWGIYVWNRVTEIRKLTETSSWRHIPGSMNPADLPSRGCNASQLVKSSWWEGTEWLKLTETEWPRNSIDPDEDVLDSERKKVVIAAWERARNRTDTTWLTKLNLNFGEMVRFLASMKRIMRNATNHGRKN